MKHFKKIITNLWYQPYTPIIFFILVGFLLYKHVYPPIQKALSPLRMSIEDSSDENTGEDQDPAKIIEAVAKLISLPSDEQPQIVAITDVEKFKDQPFFKHAKTGQQLLLYPKNKKAILFDPAENKIVDVAPIADASESAKQLADYCAVLSTQSAQLTNQSTLADLPFASPSAEASPSTSPSPSPSIATPTP